MTITHRTPAQMLFDRAQSVREAATKSTIDGTVISPCISVCRMDDTRTLCLGCFRTLEEIAGWSRMDDAARLAVWSRIEDRTRPAPQGVNP